MVGPELDMRGADLGGGDTEGGGGRIDGFVVQGDYLLRSRAEQRVRTRCARIGVTGYWLDDRAMLAASRQTGVAGHLRRKPKRRE